MLAPEGSNKKRFSLMRAGTHYVIPQTITRFRAVDSKALEKAEEEKVAAQEAARARAEALGLDAEEAARMEAEAARAAGAARAKLNWKKVRVIKNEVVLTKRWHKDMDRKWKRLRFSCRGGHTLMAGMFYRGVGGFTRAQTVQFLFSSLALELVAERNHAPRHGAVRRLQQGVPLARRPRPPDHRHRRHRAHEGEGGGRHPGPRRPGEHFLRGS